MIQKILAMLDEKFDAETSRMHVAFPATVKTYDAETRRAEVQPSIKRKLPTGEYVEMPIIVDVPVVFPGTKKCGIHFPLEEEDEVLIVCCERSLDAWKDSGGNGVEEVDPRRFALPDAVCLPGFQAVEFPGIEEDDTSECFTIYHDTKLVITNKENTKIIIEEDKISYDNGTVQASLETDKLAYTDGTTEISMEPAKFTYGNGDTEVAIDGAKVDVTVGKTVIAVGDGSVEVDDGANNIVTGSGGIKLTDQMGAKCEIKSGKVTLQGLVGKVEVS